ncbi:inactive leucine-rich repeat receptor-like protein kinase [Tripterygium wilfordii]|uniref:Inactive leucine-rich repeat receptor-like protein kinase n=1 Tax=Tripterygium wilfordii TaxID=458696 RepID=A0A7J7CPH4_TRIWF|nr:inactive leucine-rich repeat receptor-like protein kinase [Tripterygium wilfordii]
MILLHLQISAIVFLLASSAASLTHDGLALLALKSAIENDPTRALHSWSEFDSTPCHWPGVVCTRNRVTSLFLPNRGLSGYLPSELGLLDSLKRLTLSHNNFSKPIPANLFNATNLISLDISHNSLSGPIPPRIRALNNITHLDLSSNLLNGSLPEYLLDLKSIAGTLNLSYNCFSGAVPASYGKLPVMVSLDLRHNNLTGRIPQVGSLVSQGPTAFAGNPSLCGFPLQTPCSEAQNPAIFLSPENPPNPKDPKFAVFRGTAEGGKENNGFVTVPLISGVSVVIGVVSLSVWLFHRKWGNSRSKTEKETMGIDGNTSVEEEEERGKFVVLDEGFDVELEDLLRASALVVGKSRTGIVYKVVVGARGSGLIPPRAVAVRRLSEGDTTWRLKDYEVEVEAIGRVQHPNVVRLRAYYYASDKKLLVTDFINYGNLYAALHVGSATTPPLSWTARMEIARGTARGLMYIHEYGHRKYVHGSLKSTKILLDDELQPCISGFGLVRLVSKHDSKFSASSAVYTAPEARNFGSKITQKCDVG